MSEAECDVANGINAMLAERKVSMYAGTRLTGVARHAEAVL